MHTERHYQHLKQARNIQGAGRRRWAAIAPQEGGCCTQEVRGGVHTAVVRTGVVRTAQVLVQNQLE